MTGFSTSLGITLPVDGTLQGTWGDTINTNMNLLEQAITGVKYISLAGISTYTLLNTPGSGPSGDDHRNAILIFNGAPSGNPTVTLTVPGAPPLLNKVYVISNQTTGTYTSLTLIGSSGTGVVIPGGTTQLVYFDGTNFYLALGYTVPAVTAPLTASTSNGVSTISAPSIVSYMGKNKIINGNFDVWQRGTTFSLGSAATAYTADRWRVITTTGVTATVSQQAFTLGQGVVPFEPTYYLGVAPSGISGGGYLQLQQFIESVRTFAGQTVTLSFWGYSNSAQTITVDLFQVFGTGGSPSTTVTAGTTTANLTTSWQKFTYTVTFPSISGKTLGTNGDDNVDLTFICTQNINFYIAQVQLEVGGTATNFEMLPQPTIQSLCERYYETGQDALYSADVTNTYLYYTLSKYRTLKRIAPVGSNLTTAIIHVVGGFPSTNPVLDSAYSDGFVAHLTANATAPQSSYQFSWTASAEY